MRNSVASDLGLHCLSIYPTKRTLLLKWLTVLRTSRDQVVNFLRDQALL